jgi:hypothetical protein
MVCVDNTYDGETAHPALAVLVDGIDADLLAAEEGTTEIAHFYAISSNTYRPLKNAAQSWTGDALQSA